jgi:hypothetical protein
MPTLADASPPPEPLDPSAAILVRACERQHLPSCCMAMPCGRGSEAHAPKVGAAVVIDELRRGALAVDQAVIALRQGAVAAALLAALDQAHAAVHQLPRGLTEQVLSALLHEIEEHRRRGCRDSHCLQTHIRIAAIAVAAEIKAPPAPTPRPP